VTDARPQGTVTFLFTDIEGSTELLKQLGDRYGPIVGEHRRILREHVAARGGVEMDTQGDAFFFSFARARDAVAAAVAAQVALAEHGWPEGVGVRVRMSLHTGEPVVGEEGYVGIDVVRAARICSAGHGGQVLLSGATAALVGAALPAGVRERELGTFRLKDLDEPERIYQLDVTGLPSSFPPLRTGGEPLDLGERLERRIHSYVEQQLERALSGSPIGWGTSGEPGRGTELEEGQTGFGQTRIPAPPRIRAHEDPKGPDKLFRLAAGGLLVAFAGLVLLAAAIVGVVLLVRFVT
jgi:class 3 adenylate cyclase